MTTARYAHRPALPMAVAVLAGALVGWIVRSRLRPGDHAPVRDVRVPVRATPTRPEPPPPAARHMETPRPQVRRPEPGAPDNTRGPSPFPGPVPLPEGAAVDAPYTAEEPYTGRPRYPQPPPVRDNDVPDGMPP